MTIRVEVLPCNIQGEITNNLEEIEDFVVKIDGHKLYTFNKRGIPNTFYNNETTLGYFKTIIRGAVNTAYVNGRVSMINDMRNLLNIKD